MVKIGLNISARGEGAGKITEHVYGCETITKQLCTVKGRQYLIVNTVKGTCIGLYEPRVRGINKSNNSYRIAHRAFITPAAGEKKYIVQVTLGLSSVKAQYKFTCVRDVIKNLMWWDDTPA